LLLKQTLPHKLCGRSFLLASNVRNSSKPELDVGHKELEPKIKELQRLMSAARRGPAPTHNRKLVIHSDFKKGQYKQQLYICYEFLQAVSQAKEGWVALVEVDEK
jgi:CRISPR/Cas system-associated protein Cas10 (large subunit of type III CRISPR-Cas system)